MTDGAGCQLIGKVKQVVQLILREGFHSPNDKLLIDVALTFSHPVNLTY